MACRHIITIKNEKGHDIESRLFNELYNLHDGNQDMALASYAETKTGLFSKWAELNPGYEVDENGEPTISSFERFMQDSFSIGSSDINDQGITRAKGDPNAGDPTDIGTKNISVNSTKELPAVLSKAHPEEALVDRIFNSAINDKWRYNYYGKSFDMSHIHGDANKREFIKKEIIPLYKEYESTLKPKMVEWLNKGADMEKIAVYFPTSKGKSRFDDTIIKAFLSQINYHPNDKYFLYSDLKGSKYEDLGIKYREEFEGFNPIIAIHEAGEGVSPSISIFDITSMSVNKPGFKMKGKSIFGNFISNTQASNTGIDLSNTEGGVRYFINGLTAMAFKESNPGISIRKTATLSISPKNIYQVYTDMDRMVDNVNGVRENPELMSIFGPAIQPTLNNTKLDELKHNYEQDPIARYRALLLTDYVNKASDEKSTAAYTKAYFESMIADKLTKYLEGMDSKDDLLETLKNRQRFMEKKYTPDQIASSVEYEQLSASIFQLAKAVTFEKNDTLGAMSRVNMNFNNSFDVRNDLLQHTIAVIKNDHDYINSELRKFTKEVDKKTEVFQKSFYNNPVNRVLERLADTGGKAFVKLFKTTKDVNGKLINTNEIHFDENDADTKSAIRNGVISKEEVIAGKWYVDQIKEMYIQLIIHRNHYEDNLDSLTKEARRSKAEDYYLRNWKDGQIPVMSKSVNEQILSGNIKGGFAKFWKQMMDGEKLFVENFEPMNNAADISVANMFLNELDNNDQRLERMGLESKEGGLELVDPTVNNNMSTNMETIIKYFKLAGIRKIQYEKNSLPVVNATRSIMAATQRNTGEDQMYSEKYLNEYVDRIIHSKKQESSFGKKFQFMDPLLNTLVSITTFNGLAYSVPLAATSFLINNLQIMSLAFANDSAENGMFGKKEWTKAVYNFFTDSDFRNKCLKLTEMYNLDAVGEKERAENPRFSKTKKFLWGENYAHGLNHMTDYYARSIVMAAQMIKDGSFEAHTIDKDGEMQYNPKKDERFYPGGKATEDGKIKLDYMKASLIRQGIMTDPKEEITQGYDLTTARMIKTLSDKYVIGGMDPTTSVAFKSYSGGNMFMQFKSFLPSKLFNVAGGSQKSLSLGSLDVRINPATGKKEAYVRLAAFEGQVSSFVALFKELTTSKNLSQSWSKMTPEQKHANTRLLMNTIAWAVLYGLYNGLTKDWDDDDDAVLKDSRFVRVFKYGGMDMIGVWPTQIVKTLVEPAPSITNLNRIVNIIQGDTRGWKQTVPASAAVSPFIEIIEDEK